MSDKGFLRHFITEPVYVIAGDERPLAEPAKGPATPVEEKQPEISAKEEAPGRAPVQEQAPAAKQWVFKGSNRKKVLVVVDQQGHEHISPDDEAFLGKIMNAVRHELQDLAILNLQQNAGLTLADMIGFDAEKYLIFGIRSGTVSQEEHPPYEIVSVEKSKQLINCSSLGVIAGDASQKKLLWAALQKMFL